MKSVLVRTVTLRAIILPLHFAPEPGSFNLEEAMAAITKGAGDT